MLALRIVTHKNNACFFLTLGYSQDALKKFNERFMKF